MPEESTPNVGQMLKRRRQRLKLSLADVELATKIRGKFLTALEANDYDGFPHDIYSRGFVQHYASYLGLAGAAVATQYLQERGDLTKAATSAPRLVRPHRMVVTARLGVIAGVIVVIVALLWYLSYQLSALAAAPHVSVTTPANDQVVTHSSVLVKGNVTPGANISIDNVPISTDANGNFGTSVVLENGINQIRVVGTSKLGKTTTVLHNVLAKLPQATVAAPNLPTATFAGIAVAVRVAKSPTLISIKVDGQQTFEGVFLPGEQLLFQGTSDVILTTSNAGNTSVTLTNQNVVSKVLSPLGAPGEVRTGQDFAAGANFP